MLKIGTKVLWEARGTKRQGSIIAEVPPGADPMDVFNRHFKPGELDAKLLLHMGKRKRAEMSFLIREDGEGKKPKVYCPVPAKVIILSVPA